jgi:uracil permease
MEERRIIQVEEKLPIAETIPLSLQHLFAHVLPPCWYRSC